MWLVSTCIFFLLGFNCYSLAAENYFPEKVFYFSEDDYHSRCYISHVNERQRKRILTSLSDPKRDEILANFVPKQFIAGELWFDLRGIEVMQGELTGNAIFARICWDYAHFKNVDLSGAELNGALMRGASFENVNLQRANIDNAQLQCSDFKNCNLKEVNFRLSRFGKHSNFRQCNLNYARFDNCKYLNEVAFSQGTMKKTVFYNASLIRAEFVCMDLSRASFAGADLMYADFYNSIINEVDLTDTNLSYAKLQSAIITTPLRLIRTSITGAYLGDLDISKVDVSYANWINNEYFIGEELKADTLGNYCSVTNNDERKILYSQAECIYRELSEKYRRSGYISEYLKIRYRSLEAKRKLLSLQGKNLEYLWLTTSRIVDGYGTRIDKLVLSFLIVILFFSVIYLLGWTVFNRDWVRYYQMQPYDALFPNDNVMEYTSLSKDLPKDMFNREKRFRKISVFIHLIPVVFWFSIESTFRFAEKIAGIPDILHLLQIKEERLVPIGIARVIVGIQALLGALLILLAVKMVIIFGLA
ncbi:MAG: pentapeptide repeat-containing protein [bacterium]